jgi:hypothetical protein
MAVFRSPGKKRGAKSDPEPFESPCVQYIKFSDNEDRQIKRVDSIRRRTWAQTSYMLNPDLRPKCEAEPQDHGDEHDAELPQHVVQEAEQQQYASREPRAASDHPLTARLHQPQNPPCACACRCRAAATMASDSSTSSEVGDETVEWASMRPSAVDLPAAIGQPAAPNASAWRARAAAAAPRGSAVSKIIRRIETHSELRLVSDAEGPFDAPDLPPRQTATPLQTATLQTAPPLHTPMPPSGATAVELRHQSAPSPSAPYSPLTAPAAPPPPARAIATLDDERHDVAWPSPQPPVRRRARRHEAPNQLALLLLLLSVLLAVSMSAAVAIASAHLATWQPRGLSSLAHAAVACVASGDRRD